MNTFGRLFRLTSFGESHGPALGAVIDGCPAGVAIDSAEVQRALDRRRPGQSSLTTSRAEADAVEWLSGIYEGKSLGTPIAAIVRNADARPQDYAVIAAAPRPGHADAVWRARYQHHDPRGGGRSSGRETLSRVIGGAIAEALLRRDLPECRAVAWVAQVGGRQAVWPAAGLSRAQVDAHPSRCPDPEAAVAIAEAIRAAKAAGDSLGGLLGLRLEGLPIGLGEPVFGKFKARLADGLLGIGAVSGVFFGRPDFLERVAEPGNRFHAAAENYGGVQGGLTNGAPVELTLVMKPPSTLGATAKAGRHDPCILPRAVPVVEAMASLVVADSWLHWLAQPHRP